MPKVYLVRYAGVSRRKIQTGLLEGLRQAQSHLMEQGWLCTLHSVVMLERRKKAYQGPCGPWQGF